MWNERDDLSHCVLDRGPSIKTLRSPFSDSIQDTVLCSKSKNSIKRFGSPERENENNLNITLECGNKINKKRVQMLCYNVLNFNIH